MGGGDGGGPRRRAGAGWMLCSRVRVGKMRDGSGDCRGGGGEGRAGAPRAMRRRHLTAARGTLALCRDGAARAVDKWIIGHVMPCHRSPPCHQPSQPSSIVHQPSFINHRSSPSPVCQPARCVLLPASHPPSTHTTITASATRATLMEPTTSATPWASMPSALARLNPRRATRRFARTRPIRPLKCTKDIHRQAAQASAG